MPVAAAIITVYLALVLLNAQALFNLSSDEALSAGTTLSFIPSSKSNVMGNKHLVDIDHLDKKITELSDALANLGNNDDLKKLLLIIRQPGWTTPAEFLFFRGMLEMLSRQIAVVQHVRQDMLQGAAAVGRQERELAAH